MISKIKGFLEELRRRHVYQVAAAYIAVGLSVLGAAEVVLDPLGLGAARPFLVILVLLGFPLALVLAWAYQVRPNEPPSRQWAVEDDTRIGEDKHTAAEWDLPRERVSVAKDRSSIVVLPFDNLSPNPDDAYFSDGLTEELITHLSRLHSLRVISRSSAMALKDTQKDVRTIGRELDVEYVLEGSVRKAGDDLRITAQLIDARTDDHLWAESYDGTLDDVFEMQEETSRSIGEALNLELSRGEREPFVGRPIDNVQAYECYLRARNDLHKGTKESLRSALRHLEAGIEMVGENQLLFQGLAEVHLNSYEFGVNADEETLNRAEEFTGKAASLRSDSAETHYLNGRIERFRGSPVKAVGHFERAVTIDANHAGSLLFLVAAYAWELGRPSEVEPLASRLASVDPLSPWAGSILGVHQWMSGDLDQALSAFDRVLDLEPDFLWAPILRSYVFLWQDRREDALEELDPLSRRSPSNLFVDWAILLRWALGEVDARPEPALKNTENFAWTDPEMPWFIASMYALAGATDDALRWLERAVDRGWVNYPLFSRRDPLLESIRDDDRFKELMVEVRVGWESVEA